MCAIVPIVVETMKPVSLAAFTRRISLVNAEFEFSGYVMPEADLSSVFKMWDQDNSEWLFVNGWQFEIWDDTGARDDERAEARQLGLTALD